MSNNVFVQIALVCTFLGLALITSGCTYVVPFSIKNLSDHAVTVKYTLRTLEFGLEPELVSRSGSKKIVYPNVSAERRRIDFEKRLVEIEILPGEEVELFRMYDRSEFEFRKVFPLVDLQITSSNGNSWSGGDRVFSQFRPVEASAFSFGPKIVAFELEYR